ncbi:outer membrane receptor protein involved in Fe transport [Wenyingzhuangia heitensis]|uniref:Outer membrane receptor protein involved in Fe transport n=1 Tax=Wenyingzhuangia heitensis TaxID=1487859 RepID=A0ABX0U839_9FLAO|nr:TonB-dependent receptor [Wenyingzhuangia heitensis]NIJ44343.1 outer membrane receptor protein involved in Fe transport [Wenyingzhuangia heitensis]
MNKFIFFISLLVFQFSFSQQKQLFGTIINKNTQESVPFVTIYIKNSQETKTSLADENGAFLAKNLTKAKYNLVVQAIGYKPYQQDISFANKQRLDLGKIYLEEDIQALDAVVIRAETTSIEQKIDRLVIKVGKDLTNVGTDAASVLNNVQSVAVDQQTGELSLRGNSNVKVLIDGKPTNIPTDQLIKQLPANAIKNIELITNPSAKYSPEGNSGIINIELVKDNRSGFNGSVNTSGTYGRNFRGNAGGNFNYKVKNVNFFANYNFRGGQDDIKGTITRNDNEQKTYGLNNRNNHFVKFGSDIDLDKKTSISLFTVQNFNELDYRNNTKITDVVTGDLTNNSVFDLNRKPRSQTYDASLHKKFEDKKHTLDFGVSYNINKSPEDSDWIDFLKPSDNQEYNYTEIIDSESKRWIVNLDYAKPINESIFIETGLDFRNWINEKSNLSTQLVNNSQDDLTTKGFNDFDVNRKIYAGYVNYRQQIGKLGLQAGVRAEFYDLEATFNADVDNQNDLVTDDIFSVYPSFFATYELTKKDQLQASYSRRVDRPSIKQLNPIRTWGTPLLISQGNPKLQQQFTNSVEFRYSRKVKGGNVSLTGFYRRINDFISRNMSEDTQVEDRILLSYDNFDTADNYGIELAAYLKFTSWWNFNGSTDLYYQQQQGIVNNQITSVDNVLFNFRISNKFIVGKKLSLQMNQMYRGRNENIQRIRKPMFMTNLGASYKVLNNNGTFSLGFSDVFNSFRAKFDIENPISQKGEFNWESQNITLGFTYNFGNQFKQKQKPKRPGEDSDVGGGGVF